MGKKLAVGQLLSVPFGRRIAQGFALEIGEEGSESGDYRLKDIAGIADEVPFFSGALLELVKKLAAYTAAPIESVLKAAVPAAVLKPNARPKELLFIAPALSGREDAGLTGRQKWLYDQIVRVGGGWLNQLCEEFETTPSTLKALGRKGVITIAPRRKFRSPLMSRNILPTKPLALNAGQQSALNRIFAGPRKPLLLHGITGSGKTEIYLQAIKRVTDKGQGAIVMVPEIALTPQTVQRFASRFGDRVAVLHSGLSDGERYDEWHRIRSGKAMVVVGPRSAVFAPVKNLGLIVVDEEHEHSYKQEDNPRYHARDAAVLRGVIEGAKVVLGSATPSLESYRNALEGKYDYAELKERAGHGKLPQVMTVDMGMNGEGEKGRGIFSEELLEAMRLRLNREEQTILFLNRRGFSRSVTCDVCGEAVSCGECEFPYTYHKADNCLRCHLCGRWMAVPAECPHCGAKKLSYLGTGTQRVQEALLKCFPKARVLRMDADSTSRKNSHDDILGAFRRHEADVLLGTQMIAKGLDFPNVTLVGVLNADQSLNMPDFRAAERTFQLLAQVAGRAGRAELPGEVIIQTRNPGHPAIRRAGTGDFRRFAEEELKIRKEEGLPPYSHLSVMHLKAKDRALAEEWARMYAQSLRNALKTVRVSEAMPSAIEKSDGWFRYQIVLTGARISPVLEAYRKILELRAPPKGLKTAIDIDAYNMI